MFSSDFDNRSLGNAEYKINKMSYMFGSHSKCNRERIYYTGDRRVVDQDPSSIEIKPHSTPAWVIADYMLSKSRGEPLTEYEEMLISQPFESEGLRWLREYLREI